MRTTVHAVRASLLLAAAAVAAPAQAQVAPAVPTAPPDFIPIDDYLALLARISPAAQGGARAYLDAHRRRCGRDLTSSELRAAMAAGNGDPVLMSMIRASHVQDAQSLAALAKQVPCRRAAP